MEHCEEIALDTANLKPAKYLRHFDDNFVVWRHGPARLQQFLHHLSSHRHNIKFTMKVKINNTLNFFDVSSWRGVPGAYTCRTLLTVRIWPLHHMKWGYVTCWSVEPRSCVRIGRISARKLRTYEQNMIWYFMNTHNNWLVPLWSQGEAFALVQTDYVMARSLSHTFRVLQMKRRCIGNRFNVRIIFKIEHLLCGPLMKPLTYGAEPFLRSC
jgi:hypothetical protein